jgi:hypothetical protein
MAYTKQCKKTTRTIIGNYKGFTILSEITKYFEPSFWDSLYYDTNRVSTTREYIMFGIKGGNINHASDRYSYSCYSVEEAKKVIDKIINEEMIVLTEKEWHDWVKRPNAKNDYGFSSDMLLAIMKAYKKASPRRRFGYTERLTDANFHTASALLEEEKYEEFEKLVRNL